MRKRLMCLGGSLIVIGGIWRVDAYEWAIWLAVKIIEVMEG